MERYLRNKSSINENQQDLLAKCHVIVLGCGGLGGSVAESLARIGVGKLTLVDDDVFVLSNLNRQRFSTIKTIGKSKVEVAKEKLLEINDQVEVIVHKIFIGASNIHTLVDGCDLIIDALDNFETRRMIEEAGLDIPIISAAVGGYIGWLTMSKPGYRNIKHLCSHANKGVEQTLGNLSFTVNVLAELEVCLAIRTLLGDDVSLHGFYFVDLKTLEIEKIEIIE
jgi:molybdopterin/thiamine biosynthesis adenylyltransferase